jgi:transposase
MKASKSGKLHVGIDVSKGWLDVAVLPEGRVFRKRNDASAVEALADELAGLKPRLVVLEATGGLELPILYALVRRRVPVHRCEPKRARAFARAIGLLAKTDRIDARMLARYGADCGLNPQSFPDEKVRHVDALVTRRRQVVDLLTAEGNRLAACTDPVCRASIQAVIDLLCNQRKHLEAQIQQAIADCESLKTAVDRLCTIPGVGRLTAATLVASLPELGTCNRWEIAALTGTAPFNRDSGSYRGKKFCWGGRADPRRSLYMAALVGTRHNPVLKALYQRLRAQGKPAKQALTACMRKLAIYANALLRDNATWRQTTPAAT